MTQTPQSSVNKPRERRKQRLQAEIRRHAFRLFAKQGYAETSVEQIAAAADISYSTFFRYFAGKSAIAADIRFDALFIEALSSQPENILLPEAVHAAVDTLSTSLTLSDFAEMRAHYTVFTRIPELQAAGFVNLSKDARTLIEIIATRTGQSSDRLEVQTLAWSIIGSWIAAMHYWITHPESELAATLWASMESIVVSAQFDQTHSY